MLQLEAGEIVQGLDFHPAREAFAREPLPASLGLARGGDVKLMGVECDADEPARFSPLFAGNTGAGRTLRSAYSPALKRAIALASVASDCASGTALTVRRADGSEISARAVSLPFLP